MLDAIMKRFILLSVMWGGLAGSVHATDVSPADRNLQRAFTNCEQGLLLPAPRSVVGLKVLQRYFKKYETYRNAATVSDPQIVKSNAPYKPRNPQFGEKDYKTLYEQCETELVAKITATQTQVDQHVAQFQQTAAQRLEIVSKLTADVMPMVKSTMDLCAHYVQTPLPEEADDKARAQLNADTTTYQSQKKQIIKTHPGILQTPYKSLRYDTDAETTEEIEQALLYWFEYCDGLFVDTQSGDIDTEGPPLPNSDSARPAKENDDQPPPSDDGADDAAAMLADAMNNAQGERKKVIEQEKRQPDFTDNDNDQYNASTWFFDSDTPNGSECHIYTFNKDHSIANQKTTKGLCEPPNKYPFPVKQPS